ncbi:MAG: hypothetical protein GF364_21155 [Candidatus Lokiarchaeota archaeon]|nr:hypothetical protein [Candidatus Lokiarchaeota archaeon]
MFQSEEMSSIERVLTTLDLKEPDRVPVWPLIDFLPAKYYDITNAELIFDPVKSQKAYEWIYDKLGGYDITLMGGGLYYQYLNPFPSIFSAYYLNWLIPGLTLSENDSPQLVERSNSSPLMNREDYDRIIDEGLFWLVNYRRARFRDLIKLPKYAKLIRNYSEIWWNEYKVPTFSDGEALIPFEFFSFLRGMTNFMKDIIQIPDKIKEISDYLVDKFIKLGKYILSMSYGKTILIGSSRASSDFVSPKHFENLFWPYFKKVVEEFHKEDCIIQLHMDTNWTDRLHFFRELPKGKIYLHIDENTDIVKAREILGGHMVIQGNLKPALFSLGSPYQIEKETKRIIDECADGGGLWIGSEIPGDAKLENVKAMIDTCKTYGVYRK